MNTKTQSTEFEKVECSRCGGTGRYSYCQVARGPFGPYTCFKCGGQTKVLTKRGKVAHDKLVQALKVPASRVQVGDLVRENVLVGTRGDSANRWLKVTEIKTDTQTIVKNGTGEVRKLMGLCLEGGNGFTMISYVSPDAMVRVAQDKETKVAKLTAAYEYQDCLTKAGTVRKDSVDRAQRALDRLGVV